MTEREYILASNATALGIAASALREVMPVDGDITREQIIGITEPLQMLLSECYKLISVED